MEVNENKRWEYVERVKLGKGERKLRGRCRGVKGFKSDNEMELGGK